MKKHIIILLGVPGSGKGTEAVELAHDLRYAKISTGDLLRDLAKKTTHTQDEQEALSQMHAGNLVPDDLVCRLTFAEITKQFETAPGIVLDGAVRTVGQAERFQEFFIEQGVADAVIAIELALSDDVARERLLRRRSTALSGTLVPGARAVGEVRADDAPEVIEERLQKQGNGAIAPICAYYESIGRLRRIDGSRSIAEVHADVLAIVHANV